MSDRITTLGGSTPVNFGPDDGPANDPASPAAADAWNQALADAGLDPGRTAGALPAAALAGTAGAATMGGSSGLPAGLSLGGLGRAAAGLLGGSAAAPLTAAAALFWPSRVGDGTLTGRGLDATGFTPAPTLEPLPGYRPSPVPGTEADGFSPAPQMDSPGEGGFTPAPALPQAEPGSSIDDGLRGPQIVTASDLGRMDLGRTPGLGASAAMADLVAANALPGREGVVLTDSVGDPSELFPDMYRLTQATGAEYALTREGGKLVLRSGAPNVVRTPLSAEPIAHTHPGGSEPLPSLRDIQVLNDIWAENPAGPRPSSTIVWGSGPGEITRYHATGLDELLPRARRGEPR